MRICVVYHGGEFPPSERIEKTAKSLAAAGHQVFLLCNNYGEFPLHEEIVGGVHVIRVRPTFRSRGWNRILKFPVFFNPLWILQLLAVIRRFHIDALQVVDVPLSLAAVYVGHACGLPVVLDMWENYPEFLRGRAKADWKTLVFRNYLVARAAEICAVRRVDHIITVVEEQRERLIADGVPEDRISVVTNAFDEEMFLRTPVGDDTPLDAEPGCYKLLYVGGLGVERGLEDIIRAAPLVLADIPELRIYIAGRGTEEHRLRKLAAHLGVAGHVHFLGWIPFADIHSYIAKSDLCLVPHVYNAFINTTIPNKLFQYMALGKPVLVSHAKPLARIVNESRCGFVFESGNPADAAAKILLAYRSLPDATIGERGRHSVQQRYTWERAAAVLVRVYERLPTRRGRYTTSDHPAS